jgi:hypothetical protein
MASTYTPKLNLAKPAHGDVDWHIPINENWDKLDTSVDNAAKTALVSGLTVDADKNWNGKNITNLGKISPKTWLIVTGADPLLISKSHASSTTVTFAQLDGTGHVKVVVSAAGVNGAYGTREFVILKNGSQIWTASQESRWGGENNYFPALTVTAFEDLSIASGDTLTLSRTSGPGAVTLKIYSTPLVAPYGIVS